MRLALSSGETDRMAAWGSLFRSDCKSFEAAGRPAAMDTARAVADAVAGREVAATRGGA